MSENMKRYTVENVYFNNKIKSFAEWQADERILLPGELAIVIVPGTLMDSNYTVYKAYEHPISNKLHEYTSYLIKIGDGYHAFKDLPWLDTPAYADEYSISNYEIYKDTAEPASVKFTQDALDKTISEINTTLEGLLNL